MQTIKIETRFELDDSNTVQILREISNFIETGDIESHELMDGSYYIETTLGAVFFSAEEN